MKTATISYSLFVKIKEDESGDLQDVWVNGHVLEGDSILAIFKLLEELGINVQQDFSARFDDLKD
jgi:TorA maturation chaperone TorD